jgi:hypothetical protein
MDASEALLFRQLKTRGPSVSCNASSTSPITVLTLADGAVSSE